MNEDGFNSVADSEGRNSYIYVNREMSYPHGLNVKVIAADGSDASQVLSTKCPSHLEKASDYNLVSVTQSAPASSSVEYTVEITACNPLKQDECACR